MVLLNKYECCIASTMNWCEYKIKRWSMKLQNLYPRKTDPNII